MSMRTTGRDPAFLERLLTRRSDYPLLFISDQIPSWLAGRFCETVCVGRLADDSEICGPNTCLLAASSSDEVLDHLSCLAASRFDPEVIIVDMPAAQQLVAQIIQSSFARATLIILDGLDTPIVCLNKGPESVSRAHAEALVASASQVILTPGEEMSSDFRRVAHTSSYWWDMTPPAFIEVLSRTDVNMEHLHRLRRPVHGTTFDTFSNVSLIGFDGLIRGKCYYERKSENGERILAAVGESFGTYENKCTGIRPVSTGYGLPRSKLIQQIRLEGDLVLGTLDEPDNWGVWLIYGIPTAREFAERGGDFSGYICQVRFEWQRALLDFLEVPASAIIDHDPTQTYLCSSLSIRRYGWRDLFVTDAERPAIEFAAGKAVRIAPTTIYDRIFISRKSRSSTINAYRKLINETELISGLEPLGFAVIEPEKLPIADQISIFRSARVVVGLGGAGMFNTIFCRPGTKVIDIESNTFFAASHMDIYSSCGLDYGLIIGEQAAGGPGHLHASWSIDVAQTVRAIKRFI